MKKFRIGLTGSLIDTETTGLACMPSFSKKTGEMIGQCGLTIQDIPNKRVFEVGCLFQKAYLHNGYAMEAAIACKNYAFDNLGVNEVYSIVRDSNLASQNVAKRNGMTIVGTFIKHYRGIDMPHYIFSVKRDGN